MEKRKLGTQGLEVTALGLGTMGMAHTAGTASMYGAVDAREAELTIHRALEIGVDMFDTAEVYGPYENETMLGRVLRGAGHHCVIASKFGFKIGIDGSIQGVDGSPANALRALNGSLQRLQVEQIDLWYLHRLDKSVDIEDTVGAMSDAVKSGKVRYLGLSEVGAKTLERAHAIHPISALQSEYSLWERNIEGEVLAAARRLGIGIVPFSPLGRGFLTGKVERGEDYPASDYRHSDPRYQGANFDANQKIVAAVKWVAHQHNATAGQIALAWLLHQGDDIVPIPGTKRRTYLEENMGAASIQMSAADLATLQHAVPNGTAAGPRYQPRMMSMLDR